MNFQTTTINHHIFREKLPLFLGEGRGEVNAGNDPINNIDLYGLWFDNAKPEPEGGGSIGAGAEPFDWAGAWNTYQLIYGDNGGYSGSGTRGTNMSSSTGGTFAGHGAGIFGFGYTKLRNSGGSAFMVRPPDDPSYGYNSQNRTWTFGPNDTPYHIAETLINEYGEETVFPRILQYALFLSLYNTCADNTTIPIGTVWDIPNTSADNVANNQSVPPTNSNDNSYLVTINKTANITSFAIEVGSNTVRSTPGMAYFLAYNKPLLNTARFAKAGGYAFSVGTVGLDFYLSKNNQQSWTETYINTGVTAVAIIVGGWPGVVIVVDYNLAKTYMKTINVHPEWVTPTEYYLFYH